MSDTKTSIMRLQYEILNKSIREISEDSGVPEGLLQERANEDGWKQWWADVPNPDLKDAGLVQMADDYVETKKKRLQVFAIARELYLAPQCLRLESAILDAACSCLQEEINLSDPAALRHISALYKDISSRSLLEKILTGSEDESGIPSLIIRNLTGSDLK